MLRSSMSGLLLGFLFLSFSGCLGTSRYSQQSEVVFKEDLLRETAAFDLSCRPEELRVTQLGNIAGAGVSGCGQKARYVFHKETQLWIANAKASKD